MLADKSTISVKEARQIMGADADHLSEEEVELLIDQLNSLARGFVQMVLKDDLYAE